MSIQNLDFGTAADGDGELEYTAWPKVQANFEYLSEIAPGTDFFSEELGFWTDQDDGANIWRFADRVFVGEAINVTGSLGTPLGSIIPDNTVGAGFALQSAQFLSIAKTGLCAVTGISRSSDDVTAFTGTIGVSGFVINDDTGASAWGLYSDLQHEAGAQFTTGLEVAAKNASGTDKNGNPYSLEYGVTGVWLAGGGDDDYGPAATDPSNAAVAVIKNTHTWNNGILFDALGITGTDGVTGEGKAISLAKGHCLLWHYAGGNPGLTLVSQIAASGDVQRLQFDTNGARFFNDSSIVNFRVSKVSGTVTGNLAASGSTAAFPTLSAEGSATDVSLGLTAKGTGSIIAQSNTIVCLNTAGASNLTAPPSGTVLQLASTDASATRITLDVFGSVAPGVAGRHSGGTAASKSATTAGSSLFNFAGFGRGATGYVSGAKAQILMGAAEDWTDSASGTFMTFSTTPRLSTTLTERMRINDTGNLKFAGTADRGTTEGTNHIDIFNGTAPVGTLSNGISFYSSSGEAFAMNSAGVATRLTFAAPSSIGTGTKTISNASDSSTNFGKYLVASVNGTTYYVPCSTVAPT